MSRIAKGPEDPLFNNRRSRKIAKGGGLESATRTGSKTPARALLRTIFSPLRGSQILFKAGAFILPKPTRPSHHPVEKRDAKDDDPDPDHIEQDHGGMA